MKRREMAGIQQSSSIDVPLSMTTQSPVSVEVPHTVLEVRRCGWALNRIKPLLKFVRAICKSLMGIYVVHVMIYHCMVGKLLREKTFTNYFKVCGYL